MPDLQPSTPNAVAVPGVLETLAPAAMDDFDVALGCECADPALQIERWSHEAASGSSAAA